MEGLELKHPQGKLVVQGSQVRVLPEETHLEARVAILQQAVVEQEQ